MAETTLTYIKIDYASHRDALLQRIRSRWSLSWNDFLANNFGRILVDLMAWTTSTMAYLINRAAAENFISTMTLRESAVRVGGLVSYQLRNPIAASVQCEAATAAPVTATVTLAKGTTINIPTGSGTIPFELAAAATIGTGATTPEQPVLYIDQYMAGNRVLNTQFVATAGSEYVDLADSTVDLTAYISSGQYLIKTNEPTTSAHRIADIIAAPGATQKNRLVIDPAWGSDPTWNERSETFPGWISERRVTFVQGQSFTESFTGPATDYPGFVTKLSRTPVIENSIVVTVNGSVWPIASSLSLEDKDSQKVQIKVLPDGSTAAIFGDGIFGAMVPVDATITASYRVGGGSAGNVDVGAINTTIIGQQSTSQVSVLITNAWTAGEGGMDLESLAEARNNIPAHVRTNGRGVTAEDYQTLASRFSDPLRGQVRYARAVTNGTNSLLEGNVVTIYAWTAGPTGGLVPLSAGLKTSLTNYLRSTAICTDYVVVRDGSNRPAPVACRFKAFTGFSISDTADAITSTISNIISANKPGDPVVFSDMVRQLDNVSGVSALTLATPLADLNPSSNTEIFTPPTSGYSYKIDLKLVDSHTYEGQLPVSPLTPWCFTISAGNKTILIVPDTRQGFARLIGDGTAEGLATYDLGLKAKRPIANTSGQGNFYYATDEQKLYRADAATGSSSASPILYWKEVSIGGSYVDLFSGKLVISFKGDARDVTMSLITVQGYDTERSVNVYVGYTGDNSIVKRREIRNTLRNWASGFQVGSSLFAAPIRGSDGTVILATSQSNVTDVVMSVTGVTGVNRVSLDSPSNAAVRMDASTTELIKLGSIALNGLLD